MNGQRAVRVSVGDVREEMRFAVDATLTVAALKARALHSAGLPVDASDYLVKFRGAELRDEGRSIADVGVPENGAVIILPRRRQAVR